MNDRHPRPVVTLFTRPDCHLCHAVQYVIARVAHDIPIDFCIVNIDEPGQEAWKERYDSEIPVVHINGAEHARHRIDEGAFRAALRGQGSNG